MFEYAGWLTVYESPGEEGEDDALLASVISKIEARLPELECHNREIGLRNFNGMWRLWFVGMNNRPRGDWAELVAFITWIAESAPGSYGLVHHYDDEDPAHDGGMQVLVIKRGVVGRAADSFLSPRIPVIEDPISEE
jgi:hypothetical protein